MANAHNTQQELDRRFMTRALELAARGAGFTAPNPMVGCVIVKDGTIIGEGWHRGRGWHPVEGLAHAEVMALRAVSGSGDEARATGATAYVTLEPCNHTGSTGPCVHALSEANVARVVYAMSDPNPKAARGAETLRKAGIEVQEGPLTEEAHQLNRGWLHTLTAMRPYVIAKYAASLDGKIATRTGNSQWITGEAARARAHELRQLADAIIVGAGTVLADNPALTVRGHQDAAHPLRVILDSTLRTSPLAQVYRSDTPGKALIVTTHAATQEKQAAFKAQGTDILVIAADSQGKPCLPTLLKILCERGLVTLMVEGGAEILGSFYDAGIVDEVWAFIAPLIIGGGAGAIGPFGGHGADQLSDAIRLDTIVQEQLGPDMLIRGVTKRVKKPEGQSCLQAS